MLVAALYVDPKGQYPRMAGVDCWDEQRDATTYAGPHPVVAHPPCQRWCRLAGLVEARWGYKQGDDGGTFALALLAVRAHGGVLEHPAYSKAWPAHGLPAPRTGGEWCEGAFPGEWTCYVEQWRYGHKAKKATWLYFVGPRKPFDLLWGHDRDNNQSALVSWCGNRVRNGENRPRLGKAAAIHSPVAFAEVLVRLARSVYA